MSTAQAVLCIKINNLQFFFAQLTIHNVVCKIQKLQFAILFGQSYSSLEFTIHYLIPCAILNLILHPHFFCDGSNKHNVVDCILLALFNEVWALMTSQLQEEIRIRDSIEFFIAIDAKKSSCQTRIDKVVQICALFERPIHLAIMAILGLVPLC